MDLNVQFKEIWLIMAWARFAHSKKNTFRRRASNSEISIDLTTAAGKYIILRSVVGVMSLILQSNYRGRHGRKAREALAKTQYKLKRAN